MRKIFTLCLVALMSLSAWAAGERAGFWNDNASTLSLTINGADCNLTLNNSQSSIPALGNVQSLSVKEWWFKMWQSADNIPGNGVSFCYKIYPTGGEVPANFTVNWGNYCNYGNWDNGTRDIQAGNNAANINILEGLADGNYTLEYYFTANMNIYGTETAGATTQYLSNNSNNYKVTFTKATAVATGELFGTYQQQNAPLYNLNGQKPDTYVGTSANIYIVTCGNTIIGKTYMNDGHKFWPNLNGDGVTIRIWNNEKSNYTECFQNGKTDAEGETTGKFTASGDMNNALLSGKGDEFAVTLRANTWVNGNAGHSSAFFNYKRNYINNPTSDATAPTLDVANTTFTDNGGTITVTFGTVTADDEYFYYVADKANGIAKISLENSITFDKPSVQNGLAYVFRAYAVDFNGNKSAAKEYVVKMPFDENGNIAEGKTATAGFSEGGHGPEFAVDGSTTTTHWGNYGCSNWSTDSWFCVDLGASYQLTQVGIAQGGSNTNLTCKVFVSNDGTNWTNVGNVAVGGSEDAVLDFEAIGRYIKIDGCEGNTGQMMAFKEIYVHGTGLVQQVSVTSVGWASLCLPFDAEIPAGVIAYYAKEASANTITLSPIAEKIPANEGVVIAAAQGTHNFVSTTNAPSLVGNLFVGTLVETNVAAGNFVLAGVEDNLPYFQAFNGGNMAAYKAYLPASVAAAPERINFVIEGSNPVATGIENAAAAKVTKALVDGKIVIVRGSQMFNINGMLLK